LACSINGVCVSLVDCGDGACGAGEDCSTCPGDCGSCCGNGTCDAIQGEHCGSCAEDCGCGEGEVCEVVIRTCVPEGMGGAGGAGGTGGTGGVGGAGGGAGGAGPGTAPEITELEASGGRLTEGGELLLSARITDADGINDVRGGRLLSSDGAELGVFSALAPGEFTFNLTWAALHGASTIEFDQAATPSRMVEAVFTDEAGHEARRSLEITLHCDGVGACGGACVDQRTAQVCGDCQTRCDGVGAVCTPAGTCGCPGDALSCGGDCVDSSSDAAHCGGCDQACPAAEPTCEAGRCVCAGACLEPAEGVLVITELMANPDAVTDTNGEWFEIWNATQQRISLAGYQVGGDGFLMGDPADFVFEGPASIEAGGFFVVAKRENRVENGGVPVDYEARALSLRNGDDMLFLADPQGAVVDRVAYEAGAWPLLSGRSMQLDLNADWRHQDNNVPVRWCAGQAGWIGGAGDQGTPGESNVACPVE
jgi:hypothetical protein